MDDLTFIYLFVAFILKSCVGFLIFQGKQGAWLICKLVAFCEI